MAPRTHGRNGTERRVPVPADLDRHGAKVALVTGGARRIGAAIARALHADGMQLVIHHRASREAARALQDELNAARRDSVMLVRGDLLDIAKLENLVRETLAVFGRLDALVNNASSFYPTPIGRTVERDWDDLVGVNLKAPFFLAQAAAVALRRCRGSVINVADIYADRPLASHAVYCAAKAGLLALTKALARDLGPEVRVNAISPGAILWPENDTDEVAQQRIVSRTPLKRVGSPEEVAAAVRFLVSDAAFISGQVLRIDGGRSVVP